MEAGRDRTECASVQHLGNGPSRGYARRRMTHHDQGLMAAYLRFKQRELEVLSVAHLELGLPFPATINGHVPDMLVRGRDGQEIIVEAEDKASLWTRATEAQLHAFARDRSRRLIVATSEP